MKKEHFIFIIQNNNKNKKHINIFFLKSLKFLKKTKTWTNFLKTRGLHSSWRSWIPTSYIKRLYFPLMKETGFYSVSMNCSILFCAILNG